MNDIFSLLTRDGQRVLENAKRIAKKHKQKVITSEHLLRGLLQLTGCQAEIVLEKLQVNLEHLKARLDAYIKLQSQW